MATNFEYYKDEILEIANKDDDFGVVNGEVGACCASKCDKCLFYICDGLCSSVSKIQWLYAEHIEHIEQPKLTKRERAFCEVVQTGFVVRNHKKNLYWSSKKPRFSYGEWFADGGKISGLFFMEDGFTFIEDTDSKIWAVEDLLKLEVEEDG